MSEDAVKHPFSIIDAPESLCLKSDVTWSVLSSVPSTIEMAWYHAPSNSKIVKIGDRFFGQSDAPSDLPRRCICSTLEDAQRYLERKITPHWNTVTYDKPPQP